VETLIDFFGVLIGPDGPIRFGPLMMARLTAGFFRPAAAGPKKGGPYRNTAPV